MRALEQAVLKGEADPLSEVLGLIGLPQTSQRRFSFQTLAPHLAVGPGGAMVGVGGGFW